MNSIKRHTGDYFRAMAQCFFFDNGYFGAAMLLLFLAFDRYLFTCGLIASLIGYFASVRYSTPRFLKDTGLITINCFFFGIAMASFFRESPALYACLILGSAAIPLLTKACHEVMQHWKLSPLIVPYILAVWVIWLSAKGFALELNPAAWPNAIPHLPHMHPEWPVGLHLLEATFQSMGRLLFLPNSLFGLSVLALVTLFSPRRGLYFLLGTLIATVAAFAVAGDSATWEYGFFSYSAGLIGLGMASFPEKFKASTILFFCLLSAFITLSLDQFLKGQSLPTLSLPYVLTLWLAILARAPKLSMSWAEARPLRVKPLERVELAPGRISQPQAEPEEAA